MSDQLVLDELRAIRVMLEAYHRSNDNLQWIEGYVAGSTETEGAGNVRGVYVLLYGPGEKMPHPCVKVYKSESYGLPLFIRNEIEWDNPDKYQVLSQKAIEKSNAIKKGMYIEVPRFCIVRWDGKETQMGPQKMLGGVVQWSKDARELESSLRSGQSAPQRVVQVQNPQPVQQQQAQPQQTQPAPAKKVARFADAEAAINWAVNLSLAGVKKFESKDAAKGYYDIRKSEWKPVDGYSMFEMWFVTIWSELFAKWAVGAKKFTGEDAAIKFAGDLFSKQVPVDDDAVTNMLRQAVMNLK